MYACMYVCACVDNDWSTFYLLHLDVTWGKVYETEPLANITDPVQRALVLGAELCKWGESTDASTFDGYVWPRLAAAAETFCACMRMLQRIELIPSKQRLVWPPIE
jgi:N-acetyl-beta-hexosaminidase